MQGVRIPFSGKTHAGKTTSADYLVKKYDFVKLSFAGKLKEIAHDLFPEQFEKGEKPRKLLQDLSIKMREIDENVWARYVIRKDESLPKENNGAIDELRFLNEYEAVNNAGFFVVRIVRDVPPSPFSNHQSETEVEKMPFDWVIYNTSTFERLYDALDRVLMLANKEK